MRRSSPGGGRSEPRRATLVAPLESGATARGILVGLRSAGWAVDEIDTNGFVPLGQSFVRRLDRRLRRRYDLAVLNAAVRESIERFDTQVLLVVKEAHGELVEWARAKGLFIVNYWPDYDMPADAEQRFSRYDLFVTTKPFQIETLGRWLSPERVALVHHGYVSEVHRPLGQPLREEEYQTDVCYVGNASPYKARFLNAIAEALPGCTMRVFGNRWDRLAAGTALSRAIVGYQARADYMALEVCRSRINVAVHMGVDPRTGWQDQVSTRTFEIPACGGFMLHIDNDEVRSFYRVPEEIDTFATLDELIAKVRYYLDHPDERRAIAGRGHRRAVPAYSYTNRGVELAELIEGKLTQRSAARAP